MAGLDVEKLTSPELIERALTAINNKFVQREGQPEDAVSPLMDYIGDLRTFDAELKQACFSSALNALQYSKPATSYRAIGERITKLARMFEQYVGETAPGTKTYELRLRAVTIASIALRGPDMHPTSSTDDQIIAFAGGVFNFFALQLLRPVSIKRDSLLKACEDAVLYARPPQDIHPKSIKDYFKDRNMCIEAKFNREFMLSLTQEKLADPSCPDPEAPNPALIGAANCNQQRFSVKSPKP